MDIHNKDKSRSTAWSENNNSKKIDLSSKVCAKGADIENSPRLSILICTYNRAEATKNCLESLAKLQTDKQLYEIVVINNNCTDNTSEICQNFAAAHPDISFRHVIEPKQGLTLARNKAVKEAKYEILAFIDDDVTVKPDYVDSILKALEDYPEYNAGGGKVIIVFEDGYEPKFLSKYLNPYSAVDFGDKKSEFSSRIGVKFPPGCNMYFRREMFEKYGNFDNIPLNRGDDKHIFHKLKEGGERILYAPEVTVYHHQSKERCKYEVLTKQAYSQGQCLALWLSDKGTKRRRAMLIEKIFNFCVSIGLGAFYCITLHPIKAKYLVGYMYHLTKGYVIDNRRLNK